MILFNFSIVATIEMTVIEAVFYKGDFALPIGDYSPYLIMIVGIFSFYAQLFITRAIQIEEAGIVSVVRTSSEVRVRETAFKTEKIIPLFLRHFLPLYCR